MHSNIILFNVVQNNNYNQGAGGIGSTGGMRGNLTTGGAGPGGASMHQTNSAPSGGGGLLSGTTVTPGLGGGANQLANSNLIM